MSKYGNRKTDVDGITFDSIAESRRYRELKLMEQAGEIANLEMQPMFQLHPAFTDRFGIYHRAITYVGDFQYTEGKQIVVEDCKGVQTEVFRIKRKLFCRMYVSVHLRIIGGSHAV